MTLSLDVKSGWQFLGKTVVDPNASADLDIVFPSGYVQYKVMFDLALPENTSTQQFMQLSIDGGSTFLGGATDYDSVHAGTNFSSFSYFSDDSELNPAFDVSGFDNLPEHSCTGDFTFYHSEDSGLFTLIEYHEMWHSDFDDYTYGTHGSGRANVVQAHNAVRFTALFTTWNRGNFYLYGLRLP